MLEIDDDLFGMLYQAMFILDEAERREAKKQADKG